MRSALRYPTRHIRVHLGVALGALQVEALLLGVLLVPRPLPLGQPPLDVGLGAGVLWVEELGVLDLALALLRDEDLGAALGLLHHVLGLALFLALRHPLVDKLGQVVVVLEQV